MFSVLLGLGALPSFVCCVVVGSFGVVLID